MPKIEGKQRRGKEYASKQSVASSRESKEELDGHIEGTRVPDTDQSWGPGEVLQLGQPAMRFGRQVDNIIWE